MPRKRDRPQEPPCDPEPPLAKSSSADASSSSEFRFMVVGHPDELKDKAQLQPNRKHVMHDYLNKEARKPSSKDSRVKSSSRIGSKGKQAQPSSSARTRSSRNAPPDIVQEGSSRRLPSEPVQSSPDSPGTRATGQLVGPLTGASGQYLTEPVPTRRRTHSAPATADRMFAGGSSGDLKDTGQLLIATEELSVRTTDLFRTTSTGGALEPFGMWPSSVDPAANVDERFVGQSLSMHWMPTLLRARHAFLSTICISLAYDDIVRRSGQPLSPGNVQLHMQRMQVRQSVIALINESLNDPEMRIADETIVAVLHVLNSEVMGCDDRSMQIHSSGLHEMVRERGGLERLGPGGQLATVLTM